MSLATFLTDVFSCADSGVHWYTDRILNHCVIFAIAAGVKRKASKPGNNNLDRQFAMTNLLKSAHCCNKSNVWFDLMRATSVGGWQCVACQPIRLMMACTDSIDRSEKGDNAYSNSWRNKAKNARKGNTESTHNCISIRQGVDGWNKK